MVCALEENFLHSHLSSCDSFSEFEGIWSGEDDLRDDVVKNDRIFG